MRCDVKNFLEETAKKLGENAVESVSGPFKGIYGFAETPPPMDSWPLTLLELTKGVEAPETVVVRPSTPEEVVSVVEMAASHGVKIVIRGGGSAVTGMILPCSCCAILVTERLRQLNIDEEAMIAHAGAGIRIVELESELNRRGFTLRFQPQSIELATVGGAIAARGAGAYSPGLGNVEDIVQWIDVVTPSKGLMRLGDPRSPRGALTVDAKQLFIGSEGALGIIVSAGLRIRPIPDHTETVSAVTPSFEKSLQAAKRLVQVVGPELLRVLDEPETAMTAGLQGSSIIVRLEGYDRKLVEARVDTVKRVIRDVGGRVVDVDVYGAWLRHRMRFREQWRELTSAGLWADTADVAAVWSAAFNLRRRVQKALEGVEGFVAATVHAGHFYPNGAALYFTLVFDAREGVYWKVWRRFAEAVEEAGAAITHHHGLGALRLALGAWNPDLDLLCAVKRILDPQGILWSTLARVCMVKAW